MLRTHKSKKSSKYRSLKKWADFYSQRKKEGASGITTHLHELAFEGHRRLDLIRWGIYYETIQETYNELKNWWSSASYVVYDYTKKGQHELMPIPQREMDLCTQFNQNPGW